MTSLLSIPPEILSIILQRLNPSLPSLLATASASRILQKIVFSDVQLWTFFGLDFYHAQFLPDGKGRVRLDTVTDEALESILRRLVQFGGIEGVRRVRLDYCPRISEKGVSALMASVAPGQLAELRASFAPNVAIPLDLSPGSLLSLLGSVPVLDCTGCTARGIATYWDNIVVDSRPLRVPLPPIDDTKSGPVSLFLHPSLYPPLPTADPTQRRAAPAFALVSLSLPRECNVCSRSISGMETGPQENRCSSCGRVEHLCFRPTSQPRSLPYAASGAGARNRNEKDRTRSGGTGKCTVVRCGYCDARADCEFCVARRGGENDDKGGFYLTEAVDDEERIWVCGRCGLELM
ncbi:hypothetical protein M427DRAFT_50559, partial [Gonapodya prolifera JEL478]